MQTIELSSLVSEEAASLLGMETAAPELEVVDITVQESDLEQEVSRSGKKFVRQVPNHLKFHHVPTNINRFVTELYPNVLIFAKAKLYELFTRNVTQPEDVINTFVVYMLQNANCDGRPRYSRYDPIKWPDQPYYKWFLTQFELFCRQTNTSERKIANRFSRLIDSHDEEFTEQSKGMITMDQALTKSGQERYGSGGSIDYIYASEILDALQTFSSRYIDKNPRQVSFENYAASLMQLKIEGWSVAEIAEKFSISTQAVNQWSVKLREWIARYTSETNQIPSAF